MNIVLLEPEIPQNTGNIARTCVATGSSLHLIKPLGFKLDEKSVKRAGLDYWDLLDLHIYESYDEFISKHSSSPIYMATTKANHTYDEICYDEDCFIMFGKETAGIPEEILKDNADFCIRIPMREDIRSLNLSNSVAIVLYEGLRQNKFTKLENYGELTKYHW
ncbi:MAG: tRNA (cytidine(34)-2'-O)-methyltransferase [Epulopiscium sp.]|nr:tRNA (cytidine(34)-2'-O)-methyltransferase [Candidatus Epulonipiscium sp.]